MGVGKMKVRGEKKGRGEKGEEGGEGRRRKEREGDGRRGREMVERSHLDIHHPLLPQSAVPALERLWCDSVVHVKQLSFDALHAERDRLARVGQPR
jgi:hypothetical protein